MAEVVLRTAARFALRVSLSSSPATALREQDKQQAAAASFSSHTGVEEAGLSKIWDFYLARQAIFYNIQNQDNPGFCFR